jgi:hypothetical protein
LKRPLPPPLQAAAVVADASEIDAIDAALICLTRPLVLEAATDLLQHRVPIVEAAILPSPDRASHREALDRVALRHRTAAVIGVGWDPGMLSVFCELFAIMSPKGHTEARGRPGISLHHTLAALALPGDALCTELRAEGGRMQRYVYVQLEPEADTQAVILAVQSDSLFLDEESVRARGGGSRRRAGTPGARCRRRASAIPARRPLRSRIGDGADHGGVGARHSAAGSGRAPAQRHPASALWQGISQHNDDTPEQG